MTESIKSFPKQFEYEPTVINDSKLGDFKSLMIGGVGGSGLVAGILRMLKNDLDVAAHHEYGLPTFLNSEDDRLFVAVSYSGNTEETLDFLENAAKKNLNVAALSTGGKLIQFAEENELAHIRLPDVGIQPRLALGFMTRAILKLIREKDLFDEVGKLSSSLQDNEERATAIAAKLEGKIPVIYSSRSNQPMALNWKIKLNETCKIPAFYNVFPELNHNEMQGFDVVDATKPISEKLCFIFLEDDEDLDSIKKRMEITKRMKEERGFRVESIKMEGSNKAEKIFNTVTLADWVAMSLSHKYGTEPEAVTMIEEFKKLI